MFIDQFGMELELIHTIHVNLDETSKEFNNNKIVSQSVLNLNKCDSHSKLNKIAKIVPKFSVKSNDANLVRNKICLNSIDIFNHVSPL